MLNYYQVKYNLNNYKVKILNHAFDHDDYFELFILKIFFFFQKNAGFFASTLELIVYLRSAHNMSSKLYEQLYQVPVIYIWPFGDVSDFIKSQINLGTCFENKFDEKLVDKIILSKDFDFNNNNVDRFSFKMVTKKLIKFLEII